MSPLWWGFESHPSHRICREALRYRDLEEKAVATRHRFATSNTVKKQFYHYLLANGYVERVSRGAYRITQKGEKLLEILT
jgi:predicted transcriptional regulator